MPGAPKPCMAQAWHINRSRPWYGRFAQSSRSNSGSAGFTSPIQRPISRMTANRNYLPRPERYLS